MKRINTLAQLETGSVNVWKGNKLLRPGYQPINLSYGDGFYTLVRVKPGLNPELDEKELDDFRVGSEYGKWIEGAPVVKNLLPDVTDNGSVSFILTDTLEFNGKDPVTPYTELYWALYRAQKNKVAKSDWKDLLVKGKYGPALPKWSSAYFLWVTPLHCDIRDRDRDKNHPDRDINPEELTGKEVLILGRGAYQNLCLLLEKARMSGEKLDLTDPGSGAFVGFWKETSIPNLVQPDLMQETPGQYKSYAVGIWNTCPLSGFNPSPVMSQDEVMYHVMSSDKWNNVLNLMSYPEQAEMLSGLPLPADLLVYAWEDHHPDWVSSSLRNRASSLEQYHPAASIPPGYQQTFNQPTFNQQPYIPAVAPARPTYPQWTDDPARRPAAPAPQAPAGAGSAPATYTPPVQQFIPAQPARTSYTAPTSQGSWGKSASAAPEAPKSPAWLNGIHGDAYEPEPSSSPIQFVDPGMTSGAPDDAIPF